MNKLLTDWLEPITNLYLGYGVTVATFLVASVLGWAYALYFKRQRWYKIDLPVIVVTVGVKSLIMAVILKMIPGLDQLFVVAGLILYTLINPYFVTNAGLAAAIGGSHRKRHQHYRELNIFGLVLVTIGNFMVWLDGVHPPWALMLIVLILLYVVLVIPPRQAIIAQQLLYSFKGIARRE